MKDGSGSKMHLAGQASFLIVKNTDGSWPRCEFCNKYIPVGVWSRRRYCKPICAQKAAMQRRREKLLAEGHVFKNRGKKNKWGVYRTK